MRKLLHVTASSLVLLFVGMGAAEEGIRLKTRTLGPEALEATSGAIRRHSARRSHWLLEFREPVGPERLAALAARRIRVTSGLSRQAVAVSAEDGTDFASLGAVRASRLLSSDKVSPLLAAAETAIVVAEFHTGVVPDAARAVVHRAGLDVIEHPDMLPHQLLVAGDPARMAALAEWDEVAYLFPGAPEMAFGARMAACAGAALETGLVAQYVKVGTGWGTGPLHYFFAGLTSRLDRSTVESEMLRALNEWARYAPLDFTPAASAGAARTISLLFARGSHSDGYPFDGPGRVLAHTFYPAPPNSEPIAGDMHLDDDESWQVGGTVDLFTVALHEAGHALGLGHSDRPGSVMYPYYRQAASLAADDIAGIQELYGSREGGTPVTPPTDPQPGGTLSLVIVDPASSAVVTSTASLALSGRAENGSGQVQVAWRNGAGAVGKAVGAPNWIATVPLSVGSNLIVVTASDQAGNTASRTVSATRRATAVPAGGTAAPALRITSPGLTIISTSLASVTLRGTSANATSVTWSNSAGGTGDAAGTAAWVAAGIPLCRGTNNITVRAWNAAGGQSWRSVTVVRR
ncbi:MAG TPA: matrixin family metalloprotease [Bryobacteraceae bacterium]|nr:matrixin family metalloprotease [Bryobacteraceae bacterium]